MQMMRLIMARITGAFLGLPEASIDNMTSVMCPAFILSIISVLCDLQSIVIKRLTMA